MTSIDPSTPSNGEIKAYRDSVQAIERYAQDAWFRHDAHRVDLRAGRASQKRYVLGMFPYPSGNAHLGHALVYSIADAIARLGRFKGEDVLCPLGWDAFGLPAENAAIKNNAQPAEWTAKNIAVMRNEQLSRLGISFDPSKEINTSAPEFYKWTQWIFTKLHEHGLVYRADSWVNWDPVDQTVLANEQVIDGRGWRSGVAIERRRLPQWYIKITAFAEDLWRGLDELQGWSERAIGAQRNWIGRSEGVDVRFMLEPGEEITVFTTRPDTIFGVTFLAVAPEYAKLSRLVTSEQKAIVDSCVRQALLRSEVDRQSAEAPLGAFTGSYATNPMTGERVPIFVADYVLGLYGSGAVMCVPAHDQRDYDFARIQRLPIRKVVESGSAIEAVGAYEGDGRLVNSNIYDGLTTSEARTAIAADLERDGAGVMRVRYRLRDWSVSRQRFWGCPIPVIWQGENYEVLPLKYLPVRLPEKVEFVRSSGRSPLASDECYLGTTSPTTGLPALRESDTMDTFMCSAWYAWRFLAPTDENHAWEKDIAARWMPIDYYVGGLEHANQHLIYFRFLSHFLHSIGLTPTKEPVTRFLDNGLIRVGGAKMSKSKGNSVTPNTLVDRYGADALRLFLLADTPFERDRDWDETGVANKQRFLAQVWELYRSANEAWGLKAVRHAPALIDDWSVSVVAKLYAAARTIETSVEDRRAFHVAIASVHAITTGIQEAVQSADTPERVQVAQYLLTSYLKLLALFAPHAPEAIWLSLYGEKEVLARESWITIDEEIERRAMASVDLPITVNGKKRHSLSVGAAWSDAQIIEALNADDSAKLETFLPSGSPIRYIVVRDSANRPRLLNVVA